MSASSPGNEPITVEDLRRKATHIKDMAEVEVRQLAQDQRTKVIVVGVAAVLAIASLAYYLGSRRASGR